MQKRHVQTMIEEHRCVLPLPLHAQYPSVDALYLIYCCLGIACAYSVPQLRSYVRHTYQRTSQHKRTEKQNLDLRLRVVV